MVDPSPETLPVHQALYRRWRAQTFGQMVGQAAVVETLRNAVRLDRVPHGLLFVGPRGTGKTSTARIVAKAINCRDPQDGEPCDRCAACISIREGRALDVVELDAASNNRVDDMRELLPRVYTASADLRRKVFIIDEVQRIKEGWDVLLKTLEEPPDDVVFIFCTTNPSQIRPAVVSRLQRFSFRPLTVEEIEGKLGRILAGEGRRADTAALRLVARLAAGGMRDAESMLDQLLNGTDGTLSTELVRELLGLADDEAVEAYVRALLAPDALAGIAVLDRLEASGRDLVAFSDQLVARLRQLIVDVLAGRQEEAPPGATAPALAAAARRLTALDANRGAAGGFRFQLELVLFEAARPAVDARPSVEAQRAPAAGPAAPLPVATTHDADADPAHPSPPGDVPAAREAAADSRREPAREPEHGESSEPLERLLTSWPEIVAQVGRNPAYRPLVAACRPVDVRDDVVVLGFPEDQAFLRDRAEQKRSAFEEAIRAVLGKPYRIRCVATNLAALGAGASAADGLDLVEQARRIFEGELRDVAEIS